MDMTPDHKLEAIDKLLQNMISKATPDKNGVVLLQAAVNKQDGQYNVYIHTNAPDYDKVLLFATQLENRLKAGLGLNSMNLEVNDCKPSDIQKIERYYVSVKNIQSPQRYYAAYEMEREAFRAKVEPLIPQVKEILKNKKVIDSYMFLMRTSEGDDVMVLPILYQTNYVDGSLTQTSEKAILTRKINAFFEEAGLKKEIKVGAYAPSEESDFYKSYRIRIGEPMKYTCVIEPKKRINETRQIIKTILENTEQVEDDNPWKNKKGVDHKQLVRLGVILQQKYEGKLMGMKYGWNGRLKKVTFAYSKKNRELVVLVLYDLEPKSKDVKPDVFETRLINRIRMYYNMRVVLRQAPKSGEVTHIVDESAGESLQEIRNKPRKPSLLKKLQAFQKYLMKMKANGQIDAFLMVQHKLTKSESFYSGFGEGLTIYIYKDLKLVMSKLGQLSNAIRDELMRKAKMYYELNIHQITFAYTEVDYKRLVDPLNNRRFKTSIYLSDEEPLNEQTRINKQDMNDEQLTKLLEYIKKKYIGKVVGMGISDPRKVEDARYTMDQQKKILKVLFILSAEDETLTPDMRIGRLSAQLNRRFNLETEFDYPIAKRKWQ